MAERGCGAPIPVGIIMRSSPRAPGIRHRKMRRSFCTIALILAIFCGTPGMADAGQLRKVWEVDLRKLVNATNGLPEFPVLALRFSPDGRKLACPLLIFTTQTTAGKAVYW